MRIISLIVASFICCSAFGQAGLIPLTADGVISFANAAGPSALTNLLDGIQGYWKFNEGTGTFVTDSSGNGYTGTLNATPPNWVSGKVGPYALALSGGSVTAGTPSTFSFTQSGVFTVSAWVKCASWTNGGRETIIDTSGYGRGAGITMLVTGNTTYQSLQCYLFGEQGWGEAYSTTYTVNAIKDDNWHLVTMTGNGATLCVWVDSSLIASNAIASTSTFFGYGALTIGNDKTGAAPFIGNVDDVRIYDRCLAPAEVSYLNSTWVGPVDVAATSSNVGDTNQPDLLTKQIFSAYSAGFSNVTINPGTYVMANGANAAITLNSMTNLTLSASNVLMTVGSGGCFNILGCANVTIEGVTVRSQIYPFTQGRVTNIGTNNSTLFCDWHISDGYAKTNFQWWFNAVSATNQMINLQQGDIYYGAYPGLSPDFGTNANGVANNAVYLGGQTWRLNFPSWSSFSFQTNDWLVARDGTQGFAYYLNNCTSCTLLDCASQCGGWGTFRELNCSSNHILSCKIQLSPVPPAGGSELPVVANAADGIHASSDDGGPDIEDFTATNVLLDDCIAIHGFYQVVTAVSNYNITLSTNAIFPFGGRQPLAGFAIGQPVRISDTNGFFAQANCTAILNTNNGQVITLDEKLAIPVGAYAGNPNYNGSGYKIINCRLGNTRSRAIMAKADNGIITGCIISGAGMGIQLGPEYYWGEAGYVWNVAVTNNTLLNCGSITMLSAGAIGNKNITIQNNIIENPILNGGLFVNGCNQITISDNTFISSEAAYSPIHLFDSTNVTTLGNSVTNTDARALGFQPIPLSQTGLRILKFSP